MVSAAAALACLCALAWRPTSFDRPLQLLVMAVALAATGVAGARLPPPAWLLAGWGAWQAAPLSLEWLQRLSPSRAESVVAAASAGASPWLSLAADPAAAVQGTLVLMGLFALFALARLSAASNRSSQLLALGLVAVAAVQAAVGLEQYLSALHTGEAEELARGTFLNRGQFAAFLLASLGVGAGVLAPIVGNWRRRPEWAVAGVAVLALPAAGLAASMSRAALVAAGAVLLLTLLGSDRRLRWAACAGALLLVLGFAFTHAGGRTLNRFEDLARQEGDRGRIQVWSDSKPLAADYAVWGAGHGGFGAVFERTAVYFPRKSVRHAHSDFLESWIELGGFAWLVLIVPAGVVAWRTLRSAESPLALGCLAGAAAPVLQSIVDLPLQSPATAGAVACCLGLAAGSVQGTHGPRRRAWGVCQAIAALGLAAGCLAVSRGMLPSAESTFERAEAAWAAGDSPSARELFHETLALQPRAAAAWLRLSEMARAEGELDQALELARHARRSEPWTLRTEWPLAELELAAGSDNAAIRRLAAMTEAAPDLRTSAIVALWRAGVSPVTIEAELAHSDGRAAGDYLAFLARREDPELRPAFERLVVDKGLRPPPDIAAYVAKRLPNEN